MESLQKLEAIRTHRKNGAISNMPNKKRSGSREEDEVSGFFVLSHLWMRGYFRLSKG